MSLVLTEEQQMLKTSAKEFLKEKGSIALLRKLRDADDPLGFDPKLWQEMVEMGWASLVIPEAYGGLDFGYVGLGQVLEECGRTLTASPLISTVLLCGSAIQMGGSKPQKERLLPQIATGDQLMALAFEEGQHHAPQQVTTTATLHDDAYLISGVKSFVLDGHVAKTLIVSAKTVDKATDGQEVNLFLVDAAAAGVHMESVRMMDSRRVTTLNLEQVRVSRDAILGSYQSGAALLAKTLDIARIGLAAEMLGGIQEAFERTLAYLKERQQFGVAIGTFQALQHRAAKMFCEIELCKSVVIKALKAIDMDSADLPVLASLAKAKVGQTYKLVSNEGIQLFGGIGMTDDEEIGFFLKRARVAQHTFGDTNFHLDRLAKLKGY